MPALADWAWPHQGTMRVLSPALVSPPKPGPPPASEKPLLLCPAHSLAKLGDQGHHAALSPLLEQLLRELAIVLGLQRGYWEGCNLCNSIQMWRVQYKAAPG